MPTKAANPVPHGMHTVTPVLNFRGNCSKAIDFYKEAFGATVVGDIATGPGGMVLNAMLKIGNSILMLSDLMQASGPTFGLNANLWIYTDDCDALFNRAVSAGCKAKGPMLDMFWGDRVGALTDPFDNQWSIASQKFVPTPEEMRKSQEEWMKSNKM